jgi:hypothetical protein
MLFEDEFDDLAALAYRTAFRIVGTRAEAEETRFSTRLSFRRHLRVDQFVGVAAAGFG